MSFSKNLEFKKTSFLSKSNSLFIEEMYLKFIKNDPTLAQNWKDYFRSLDEDLKSVVKEIEGPSWQPNKKKINRITDIVLGVPAKETARVQELHILLGHLLCAALDESFN